MIGAVRIASARPEEAVPSSVFCAFKTTGSRRRWVCVLDLYLWFGALDGSRRQDERPGYARERSPVSLFSSLCSVLSAENALASLQNVRLSWALRNRVEGVLQKISNGARRKLRPGTLPFTECLGGGKCEQRAEAIQQAAAGD
jgi:hypothetical protein